MSHLPPSRPTEDQPPPPPPPPPPGDGSDPRRSRDTGERRLGVTVADGLALTAWVVIAPVLIMLPLAVAGVTFGDGGPAVLSLLVAIQVVELLAAIAWLSARGRLSLGVLGPRPLTAGQVPAGIVGGVVGFLGVLVLLQVGMTVLGPVDAPEQTVMQSLGDGTVATIIAVVIAVVGAPLLEEFVFRGVLFQALRARIGLGVGMVVSGLAFAAVHLEVAQPLFSVGLVALGTWFAWIFHRSGNLAVPVIAHATYNGVAVALTLGAA